MKKTVCLIAAVLMLLTCAACAKHNEPGNVPGVDVQPTEERRAEWPAELTSLPEFKDCEKIEYAGATTTGY